MSYQKSKQVGEKLKEWREEAELTLEEAASELQISINVLLGIESGVIRTPDELARSLAHFYEVAEEEFTGFLRSLVSGAEDES